MKILIGCETSGRMRRAFSAVGHDVTSCDLLPSDDESEKHVICDVRDLLHRGWDMAIFHTTCTRLCNSGVRWLHVPPPGKTREEIWQQMEDDAALFSDCWNAPIDKIACENSVMHRYARERIVNYQRPSYVQPWWFGDPFFKSTGFTLKNLPPLVATNKLTPPHAGTPEHKSWSAVHRASPGPERWKNRSRTFPGLASAAAAQWGVAE